MKSRPKPGSGQLGERVAAARRSRGWTQADLARRTGLERTALAKIESGTRAMSAVELTLVARALGTSMEHLASESKAPRNAEIRMLRQRRAAIQRIAHRHGATSVRIFGSVARGEASEDSDIDFLIELEPGRSLLDLGGMLHDLEALLGRRVDVVTPGALKARIRDRVLAEAIPL